MFFLFSPDFLECFTVFVLLVLLYFFFFFVLFFCIFSFFDIFCLFFSSWWGEEANPNPKLVFSLERGGRGGGLLPPPLPPSQTSKPQNWFGVWGE